MQKVPFLLCERFFVYCTRQPSAGQRHEESGWNKVSTAES